MWSVLNSLLFPTSSWEDFCFGCTYSGWFTITSKSPCINFWNWNWNPSISVAISLCLPVSRPHTRFQFPSSSLITPVHFPLLFLTFVSLAHVLASYCHLLPCSLCPAPHPQNLLSSFAIPSFTLPSLSLGGGWAGRAPGQEKQRPDLLCVVWLVIFISSNFLGPNSSLSFPLVFLSLTLSLIGIEILFN